jgi:CspA family cold shock protein
LSRWACRSFNEVYESVRQAQAWPCTFAIGPNADKDVAFISQDGGGPDIIARYFSISGNGFREQTEGGQVSFDTAADPKWRARPATAAV